MIDSKIKPQPGEGRGINQKGPGLQKEEPDAGAALPDRDSDFECVKEKDQVRTSTTEVLERDCGLDVKVAGCGILAGLVLEA